MNKPSPTDPNVPSLPVACPEHPPHAPLVLRVGVTGHRPDPRKRPNPDVQALRGICRKLLLYIQDSFLGVRMAHDELFAAPASGSEDRPAGLRIISSLAEGADQWVAGEAEKLGGELQAVLPFERTEYEKDFKDASVLNEHRRLRDCATAVFELDGARDREGDSYLAAGRVLLNQSDLLFAIWDGADAQGVGGTGQIVREALQRGIPTLWINWNAPADWKLLLQPWRLLQDPNDATGNLKVLERKVFDLLLPPQIKHADDERAEKDLRETYFSERHRSWTLLGGWWTLFRDLLRGKLALSAFRVPEFIAATKADWQRDWEGKSEEQKREHQFLPSVVEWVDNNYFPHYAWANQLSIYYGNLFRSSFVLIYLLGAAAVLLALIGYINADHKWVFRFVEGGEIFVIIIILVFTLYGRQQRWQQRWIDYRTMAERLRLSRFSCLLGGVWNQTNVPSHLATYGNPATTWMNWHARAVDRAAGFPNAVVDKPYLLAARELLLEALIDGQEEYHQNNVERLRAVDHRLHFFGTLLFFVTGVACIVHFFDETRHWLSFIAAFLPALGAAMAAIRSQGEFQRVIQRSRAMSDELGQLAQAVASVPARPNELNSQLLQQLVEQTTRLMYNEVLDWRIVFQDRPLVLPA
jgi:hypothetical protein